MDNIHIRMKENFKTRIIIISNVNQYRKKKEKPKTRLQVEGNK